MTTASEFAELLAPIIGLHASTIERHARHLRRAELLPPEDAPLSPEAAATLLVAVMGGRSPTEAVEAVRVIGGTPLWRRDELLQGPDGRTVVDCVLAVDLRIPPSAGSEWARMSRSLVGALGYFIESARDCPGDALPEHVFIRRSLTAPLASLATIPVQMADGSRRALWFQFGNVSAEAAAQYMMADLRMAIAAVAPGFLIRMIGDLLAGRPDSAVASALAVAAAVQNTGTR